MKELKFIDKFIEWVQKTPPCLVDVKAYNDFSDLVKEALTIKLNQKKKRKAP